MHFEQHLATLELLTTQVKRDHVSQKPVGRTQDGSIFKLLQAYRAQFPSSQDVLEMSRRRLAVTSLDITIKLLRRVALVESEVGDPVPMAGWPASDMIAWMVSFSGDLDATYVLAVSIALGM